VLERRPLGINLRLIGICALLFILTAWLRAGQPLEAPAAATISTATQTPTRTPTPEPIIPTPTPTSVDRTAPTSVPPSRTPTTVVPSPSPTIIVPSPSPTIIAPSPTPIATRATFPTSEATEPWRGKNRWGVGVVSKAISHYDVEPLRLGWYLQWNAQEDPRRPGGIDYAQMVRLKDGALEPSADALAAIAQANPGSLWLIGNEPDVKWQDNVEPAPYARLYHEAYHAIKTADPTAQVAIGGVAQPTPLRLRYLDQVLVAYKEQFGAEMPVDVWNVHNFILREEWGSWGVDIPPGMPDERGTLYEIEDSDSLEIFQQQIVDFRQWMARHGYQDRPLIVSEYGILMPEDYGFPPEKVVAFLRGTFDFFLTATDSTLGYPDDAYRLVQRWCWYSLDAPEHLYPTGNLFDPLTGQMTAVGVGWVEYVENR
jgi:hypothetical protein